MEAVRFLFAFAGGRGHAEPLLPLVRAAQAAGHAVALTGTPRVLAAYEDLALEAFSSAPHSTEPPERVPLRRVDVRREERDLRDGFAHRLARARASDLLELCRAWRPDVIVCDETDFGSMIAAERLGIPHATVLVIAAGSLVRPDVVAETLDRVRVDHGLAPDPALEMLRRHAVLSPFPPSFRDPRFPLPPNTHSFRIDHRGGRRPGRVRADGGDAPLVYFTLGTVFNVESGDLFARVLAGLGQLDVAVVATVGAEIDPGELEPLPANVRVERFVAQAEILPRCAAVVSHGGSGSLMGALAHGLPSVLLPIGADQPLNARRCEELGVALVLDAVDATPEDVRDAVAEVLATPSYRAAADALRNELESLPPPENVVPLLESLGRTRS